MFFRAMVLPAQDENPAEGGENGAGKDFFLFPVHIPLQTAAGGRIGWRPDWPVNIPVDAFIIFNDDGARRVSALTLENGETRLTARRGLSGGLSEFPVFLNGDFYQFSAKIDSAGKIRGFTVDGENPQEIEFLAFENPGDEPTLARIHQGESWFFASIMHSDALILETWYDAGGNPLAVFTTELDGSGAVRRPVSYRSVFQAVAGGEEDAINPENGAGASTAVPVVSGSRLYFDSMANTTLIDTDGNVCEALYNGSDPRYWKQPDGGRIALQWDETGCLVRMAGTTGDGQPLDYRYQYKFDGQGAWTERLEVRMTPELDVLIPVPGDSFRRTIEYR
ncbi:MAG: hypothetical protein LBF83_09560 [Spirochaetaceae bacterium]|jgi:hypothetical protein|nr:hypothetical protein [Spirochaetaceae bacterium]